MGNILSIGMVGNKNDDNENKPLITINDNIIIVILFII